MISLKEIIIIQHCQSEHHINEMSGGWTDTPLTKLGRKQANLIGLRLKSKKLKKIIKEINPENYTIYSSDLKRAWQTAEIVGEHLNLEIIAEKGLREINTGVAAGKTKKWANENRNPKKSKRFDLDYQLFPRGETWREFYSRVCTCMDRIINSEVKNIIIVTHGGTLAYIIAWWMKFEDLMLTKAHFSALPASISVLQESSYYLGSHNLKLFNDISHLFTLNHSKIEPTRKRLSNH